MVRLTLYSRPGCHLCDELKALIALIGRDIPLALDEVDISGDPDLETRYGLEIPVLVREGRKIAKVRATERELRRQLASSEP